MACDAATLLAAAAANGYFKLSQRDVLRCIAYVYATSASLTLFDAFQQAVNTGKELKLSDRDLMQGWLVATCSTGCDAQTLYTQAVAQGMHKLSERNLWDIILQSSCTAGCDAQSLETASKDGTKYSARDLLMIIVWAGNGMNAQDVENTSMARGYSKLSHRMILECLAVQLCSNPPTGANIVPPGATCQAGSYTLNVKANTTYQITWGTETSVTVCGNTYASPGVGGITVVATGACTTMVFVCGGGAITTRVQPTNKTPTPSNFTFAFNATFTNAVATWGTVPAFVENTELWTSSDGVNFALAATVAAPGTTATVAAPTLPNTLYAKVRFNDLQASPTAGPFSATLSVTMDVVTDWRRRVQVNGDPDPAAAVVTAATTFYNGLVTDALTSKMIALNMVAPGGHRTMRTPLIVGPGSDPWNTTSIQAGAVTASGWFDNPGAVNQSMDTGCKPTTMGWTASSAGFTFYVTVNDTANTLFSCGVSNAGQTDPIAAMFHNYSGVVPHAQTSYLFNTTNQTSRQLGDITGFVSANRTSTTSHVDYWANSGNAFQALSSEAVVNAAPTQANNFFFGGANVGGSGAASQKHYGFFALHMGLTAAEAQNFFNRIQTLMTAWGWQV